MIPKYRPNQGITIHHDASVSYFSVSTQTWRRVGIIALTNNHDDFNALSEAQRKRINTAFTRTVEFRKLLTELRK